MSSPRSESPRSESGRSESGHSEADRPGPARYLLLPGPTSGKRGVAAALARTEQRLLDAGFTVDVLHETSPEAAVATVCSAVSGAEAVSAAGPGAGSGTDLAGVIVLGGDGMVNIAIQALAGTQIPLGIIALGTGNDTARTLGLPLRKVDAALDVILSGRTRRIDLARAGDRLFVTVLAAGFDAAVNERANQMRWPKGQARYSIAIVAVLSKFKPISYTLELELAPELGSQPAEPPAHQSHKTLKVDAMLVAVANTDSMGGGLKVTYGAKLDDGALDVVLFRSVPRRELIRNYPKLYTGAHVGHPAYEMHRVTRVKVCAPDVIAYADGERFGPLPLEVEVVPAALSVFVA